MSNGKDVIILLIAGLIEKTQCDSIVRVLKTSSFATYKNEQIFS